MSARLNWTEQLSTLSEDSTELWRVSPEDKAKSVESKGSNCFKSDLFLGFRYVRNGRHFARNTFSMELVPIPLCREIQYDKTTSFDRACSLLRANFRLHPTIMTSHYDNKTFVLRIIFFREHKLLSLRRKLWCDLSVSCLSLGSFGLSNMGNCLKSSGQDDISLLHGDESPDSPRAGEPPPPYQVQQKKL